MTSFPPNTRAGVVTRVARPPVRRVRPAFTMVELLVVLGIMVALMAILVPAISKAYKNGVRSRMAADLQAISQALEFYKTDFGDYPRFDDIPVSRADYRGAYYLCRAMLGPEAATVDGADGMGFRTRVQGKVWGPYLQVDRFKVTANYELADRYGKAILYYPGNKAALAATTSPDAQAKFVSAASYALPAPGSPPKPYYNSNDNRLYLSELALQRLLGAKPSDGSIYKSTEISGSSALPDARPVTYAGPYILWSAGPDQSYGPADPSLPVSASNPCDDVANFPRADY